VDEDVHITQAAQALSVTPVYLRLLEKQGRIPRARRDYNGRVYSEFDIALLRALGVGQGRIRKLEEIVGEGVLR
jgi:DNA-binding transcriptional MerR regulator